MRGSRPRPTRSYPPGTRRRHARPVARRSPAAHLAWARRRPLRPSTVPPRPPLISAWWIHATCRFALATLPGQGRRADPLIYGSLFTKRPSRRSGIPAGPASGGAANGQAAEYPAGSRALGEADSHLQPQVDAAAAPWSAWDRSGGLAGRPPPARSGVETTFPGRPHDHPLTARPPRGAAQCRGSAAVRRGRRRHGSRACRSEGPVTARRKHRQLGETHAVNSPPPEPRGRLQDLRTSAQRVVVRPQPRTDPATDRGVPPARGGRRGAQPLT
jgi:hypothetical protein